MCECIVGMMQWGYLVYHASKMQWTELSLAIGIGMLNPRIWDRHKTGKVNDKYNRKAYTTADNIIECDRKRFSRHPAFWIIVSYKCVLACLCPRQIYLVAMWFTNSSQSINNVKMSTSARRIILYISFVITIHYLFESVCESAFVSFIQYSVLLLYLYIYAFLCALHQEYDDQCGHHSEIFSRFTAAISYTFL